MAEERHSGERRELRLLLEEILPAARQRDEHGFLVHAIRRALESDDLRHLRHARRIFDHLPRSQRHSLCAAMLVSRQAPASRPAAVPPVPGGQETAPAVCFEVALEPDAQRAMQVEFRPEPVTTTPVRVTIEPGTLPSVAADALRRITAMIEADRRLLSARFWQDRLAAESERRDVR